MVSVGVEQAPLPSVTFAESCTEVPVPTAGIAAMAAEMGTLPQGIAVTAMNDGALACPVEAMPTTERT